MNWALEMSLSLYALITKGYFLGLRQDIDHFDRDWASSSFGLGSQFVGKTNGVSTVSMNHNESRGNNKKKYPSQLGRFFKIMFF